MLVDFYKAIINGQYTGRLGVSAISAYLFYLLKVGNLVADFYANKTKYFPDQETLTIAETFQVLEYTKRSYVDNILANIQQLGNEEQKKRMQPH
jgi:hypothetical protein